MNPKQELFVEEYLKCFNATKAAKAAGYSEKTAYSIGQRLLKDVEIDARVRERLAQAAMDANEVLYHLAQIARGDMDDLVDANGNLDIEKARKFGKTNLIKRVKNRVFSTDKTEMSEMETEGYDRLKALELIGKHLAMFTDRVKVDSWEDEIVALLKAGTVTVDDVRAEIGNELAENLFKRVGLSVITGDEGESS